MGALIALTLADMGTEACVAELNPLRRESLNGWGIRAAPLEDFALGDFSRVFVAVNSGELVERAVRGVHGGGRVHVFAGLPAGSVLKLDAYDLHYRRISVLGCSGFTLGQFRRAWELIRKRPEHYRRLITHVLPQKRARRPSGCCGTAARSRSF